MGHHNPSHIEADVLEMKAQGLDDVLLAAQENDFAYFGGKLEFTSKIANEHGLRPIAIFWGALNLFGGGRSSQFLLQHPQGRQVGVDGAPRPQGCYMNPACVSLIETMIDTIGDLGFQGYFIDEPRPLRNCYCAFCRAAFEEWYGADLGAATDEAKELFREKCVVEYVKRISVYCKTEHPELETMACLMPCDSEMWDSTSKIAELDNLGTDIYWVNDERDVEEMIPILGELDAVCKKRRKLHHEWLQCWNVRKGREDRIVEQGRVLIRNQPDSLYVWGWKGQVGTSETCDDPEQAWRRACEIFEMAKRG